LRTIKTRATDLAAIAVLVILVIVAFADMVIGQSALYVRDVSRFFVPNFTILHDAIRSGALPFWNARYNGGQPFAANPAYAALYPPQWLFSNLQLEIVAHYLLAAIGMYVFLRSLRLRPLASLFGALSFSFGGMLLSLSNLVNVLFGVAWFPWLAFAARRRNLPLAGLFLGIILIIGDQALILQAGFLLIAAAIRRREWKPAMLIIVAALAVGSAQIIPALDHQRDSGRAAALPYSIATQWTLPPARLLELAFPSLFGSFRDWTFYWAGKRFYEPQAVPWVFSFYSGMLVFVLACAGFMGRIRGWAFTAAVVTISTLVSIFPVLYWIGLRSIRYPEKFFIAGVFTLIVFASIAADRLLEDERLRQMAMRTALVVAIAAVGSLLWVDSPLFAKTWQLTGYFGDFLEQARSGAIVTVTTALILTLLLAARRLPPALLVLFVLADLGPRIKGLTPRIDASYYDPPSAAMGLRGARVYNDADWRLVLLGAPHIPVEQRAWRVRNGLLPETQAIWGVEAVLENDITLTNLLPSIDFSRAFWAAQLSRRADLVQKLLAMAGTTHVIELRDGSSAADPIRVVRLGNPRFYFARGPGRILRAVERPNAIDLDVEADGKALLVIAVTRHKYWKGILDGMPSPLQPANIAFQSMVIPPGKHHVALRYRNPLVMIFGCLSIVSVLLLVVFSLRSTAPQPPWPH
jgi:hypothetical protein